MKNILFLAINSGWGGSEILWSKTASYFAEHGIKTGIAINAFNPMPKQITEMVSGGKVEIILKKSKLSLGERLFNRVASQHKKYDIIKEYKEQILAWKPNFVVVSQGDNGEGADMMNFLADNKIKYVTISQAAIDYMWPSAEYANLMESGYKSSQKNYFVSKANFQLTEMHIGASIDNGQVVRNPYNVPYNTNLLFPDSKNGFKLACVGRYEIGNKGQDVLLRVLNEKKWRERNVFVTFYGSGHHRESLQKLIAYFKLPNVVLGDYLETIDIWKTNHALVMPTRFEGLPLALVEAMLCGRFGIVTNVSGNKEVVIDNVNGFIAEAPQVEYVDAALERAWVQREHWENIGKNAKAYIKTLVPEDPIHEFFNELSFYL